MLAVVKSKPEVGMEIKEMPEPELKKDQALIEVKACGICGSDLHIKASRSTDDLSMGTGVSQSPQSFPDHPLTLWISRWRVIQGRPKFFA